MSAGKFGKAVETPLLSQAFRLRWNRNFSIGNFRWFFNGDMNKIIAIPRLVHGYNTVHLNYWRVCMQDHQTAELGSLVTSMESNGGTPDSDALNQVARILAKLFGVDTDEVAVLKLVPKYKSLKFIIPEKLTPVG